jgi:hypothetical protein
MLRPTPALRFIAAAALLLCAGSAHAQYSWIGENGVRHFSDLPPPPGTPPHKILKAPGRPALAASATSAAVPAPAMPAPPKTATTLAERDKAFQARIKLREEQEKKEAADAQLQRSIAANCQSARDAKAQAESGMRVARVDASGERRFMTDEEKAAQAAHANRILETCR